MGIWDYNRRIDRSADAAKKQEDVDDNGVAPNAHSALKAMSSWYGEPLPSDLKRKYEGSLGADLSDVRVHRSAESQTAAKAVGAKAYTVGRDIHFGEGQYNPSSPEGEHLLAHEVAHTVQQQGGIKRLQLKDITVSRPTDSHEIEADRAADAMVTGQPASVQGAPIAVHRKAEKTVPAVPGGEAAATFDFAIPLFAKKEVLFYEIGAKLGGSAGVTFGPAEEKEDQKDKISAGLGGSHEAGVGDEPGESSAALTLEAEHKWKATPLDCEITTNGDASLSPKGASLGIGIKLSHPLGPFKVTLEPLHVDILKWEAGKEPQFGSVKSSLAVSAPPFEYKLNDGRKASFNVASKLEIAGEVTPSSFLEWLAKKYGEEAAARLIAMGGEGVSGAEILSTAVALAPAAVSLGVGAVSMAACAEAGARGDLDRRLEEGAIDTMRANLAYALLMSGAESTDGCFGPEAGGRGPRQMRAELRAIADLAMLSVKQGIPLSEARKQLKQDKAGFTRLVKAGSAAYDVYLAKVAEAVRAWRANNWIYASASTETDDVAASEKIVRAKLFGA